MFTEEQYLLAWAYYGLGAVILFLGWWFLTKGIQRKELRILLRLIVLVCLLVPAKTTSEGEYLSPAWLASVFDALMYGPEAFWRAGTPLIISLLVAIAGSCALSLAFWFRGKSQDES